MLRSHHTSAGTSQVDAARTSFTTIQKFLSNGVDSPTNHTWSQLRSEGLENEKDMRARYGAFALSFLYYQPPAVQQQPPGKRLLESLRLPSSNKAQFQAIFGTTTRLYWSSREPTCLTKPWTSTSAAHRWPAILRSRRLRQSSASR